MSKLNNKTNSNSNNNYRKQCLMCDKWFTGTEDVKFCGENCAVDYRIMVNGIPVVPLKEVEKQLVKESVTPFTPEYAHDIHMLLHNMVDIFVGENGFVTIKYFPHMNEEVRLAYGVAARIEEQIL